MFTFSVEDFQTFAALPSLLEESKTLSTFLIKSEQEPLFFQREIFCSTMYVLSWQSGIRPAMSSLYHVMLCFKVLI